jgi:hypothetical protein
MGFVRVYLERYEYYYIRLYATVMKLRSVPFSRGDSILVYNLYQVF